MTAPTDHRPVTLEGWKSAVLDELLFRAASTLSERGAPDGSRSVDAHLDVAIAVTAAGALELRFDSLVDGAVVTTLAPPF